MNRDEHTRYFVEKTEAMINALWGRVMDGDYTAIEYTLGLMEFKAVILGYFDKPSETKLARRHETEESDEE